MAQMQSIDLLKTWASDENLKTLPELVIAAETKKQQIIEAAKFAVNNYCIKPFNRETLNTKPENIFNNL